ncbi:MAG TPA: phenylalanine--tRNA ligase subunit alpha [archaeon]|nr:phenylalanine--tRNA ligase subunit alpha [archaeon]
MKKYILTEEGRRYLENGLPEKKLLGILPASIEDAKKKIDNFSIALQWAKKNNWIEIKEGIIILKKMPEKIPEEEALEKINKGKNVDDDIILLLLSRHLIEEERETMQKRAEKLAGKEVTFLTEELIKTGQWKNVKFREYNVEVTGKKIYPGKSHPYQKFISEMKKKLLSMGFVECMGPIIDMEFWNFDALFQPQNHPARDWTSTYSMKYPVYGSLPDRKIVNAVRKSHETYWKYKWDEKKAARLMPRAQGTAISARMLPRADVPGKYFAISRCFRPDVLDATHLIEFNQIEGIILDETLTFRNLLGMLEMFAKEIAHAEKVKFYPDYFPFTEPSVQMSAKHPTMGWIEFGGAGIFREELTKPLGIDIPVIAWGLGLDRLAMFALGVKDIRYLFSNDLKWLREVVA